ncbi:hypothetical protein A3I99_01325 [Candidatus Kaiserbacteria bacterium RIFCSPLOWO2_02_FULL_45_11b]|uniref:Uncharacterized protein n=1 Tax=Candidatus Kaiserbacteria bacterium RIFCSPLOWO2_12_FULL_45_26 TaxID=1798525 RepID=A0A1F6FFT0_9BACT|nr:MAG: hypothetical protein A2Z56_02080 [Candidatus Kaiserbacteria bacterium RIFCSPHIGHO2_12_45_16]OGG70427.1 MAG: hypothetical protein A2929_01405 [Candidatus Kaiserbacteria bacterium RIFCSPLOWO2_01_FULL_45_25]OGG80958.1 MAG: hypothetical protein A3I99_01325 [Candidatus Kaiserbacteria bacterium RIFCSPLOWO2_02_FULL_45_11b]OGG84699.1 MAG: hypothetical protein A3G90_01270 [Candidatus Kaiserbacteria bacterium RIFCSPLOWO2_12_FULL_45_26]
MSQELVQVQTKAPGGPGEPVGQRPLRSLSVESNEPDIDPDDPDGDGVVLPDDHVGHGRD